MRRTGTILLLMVFCAGMILAVPRVKIVTEYVTPDMLATNSAFTGDSTVANGLRTVAKGTFVYLRAWNFGDTAGITSASWTMLQKPSGSNATLAGLTGLPTWQKFPIPININRAILFWPVCMEKTPATLLPVINIKHPIQILPSLIV